MPGMMPPMMPGMMLPPRIPAASVQPTGPVNLLTTFSSALCFTLGKNTTAVCEMLNEAFAPLTTTRGRGDWMPNMQFSGAQNATM